MSMRTVDMSALAPAKPKHKDPHVALMMLLEVAGVSKVRLVIDEGEGVFIATFASSERNRQSEYRINFHLSTEEEKVESQKVRDFLKQNVSKNDDWQCSEACQRIICQTITQMYELGGLFILEKEHTSIRVELQGFTEVHARLPFYLYDEEAVSFEAAVVRGLLE